MGDLARARDAFQKAVTSKSEDRANISRSSLETARARLAALDFGALQPAIPAAPSKAASATSIPTPAAIVPAVAAGTAVQQGRRIALVIGNSAYKNVPALPNPKRDAEAIAASLRAVGFEEVTLVSDSDRGRLLDTLKTFANNAEKADWAVVYYAGHGMEVSGVNYLIPIEAKVAVDRDVQYEAVPLDQVMTAVEGAKKLKLVCSTPAATIRSLPRCKRRPPCNRWPPPPRAAAAPARGRSAAASARSRCQARRWWSMQPSTDRPRSTVKAATARLRSRSPSASRRPMSRSTSCSAWFATT